MKDSKKEESSVVDNRGKKITTKTIVVLPEGVDYPHVDEAGIIAYLQDDGSIRVKESTEELSETPTSFKDVSALFEYVAILNDGKREESDRAVMDARNKRAMRRAGGGNA